MALMRRVEVAVVYPQRIHLFSASAVPPHDRLRARTILCYTTASGNEAEEYLPSR